MKEETGKTFVRGTIKPLEWDQDGRRLRMDESVQFGKGYDWDAYELMRQEGYGLGCGYIIWPDRITSKDFNLYGTADGIFIQNLQGEEAAKFAAQADYEARIAAQIQPDAEALPVGGSEAGWQPIETAPKDGMEVLLYDKYGVTVGAFRTDDNFPEDAPLWLDNSYDDFSIGLASRPVGATHWMPLPSAPDAQEKQLRKMIEEAK